MSFVRPEVARGLQRYREVIIGLGVMALGLLALSGTGWMLQVMGGIATLCGASLAYLAWRRAGFSSDSNGPGAVAITERRIAYFTPSGVGGGVVSLDALTQISVRTTTDGPDKDDMFWVLEQDDGTILSIPSTAADAENLFDAISALPGVKYDEATRALRSTGNRSFVIWSKPRPQLQ